MNQTEFRKIIDQVMQDTCRTLDSKGKEYANADKLSNFKAAGQLEECIPEKALFGMVAKHIIALRDFIKRLDNVPAGAFCAISNEQWKEKTHDIIAYMILLWALIEERTPDLDTTNIKTN